MSVVRRALRWIGRSVSDSVTNVSRRLGSHLIANVFSYRGAWAFLVLTFIALLKVGVDMLVKFLTNSAAETQSGWVGELAVSVSKGIQYLFSNVLDQIFDVVGQSERIWKPVVEKLVGGKFDWSWKIPVSICFVLIQVWIIATVWGLARKERKNQE
jgi:hypothetical protein